MILPFADCHTSIALQFISTKMIKKLDRIVKNNHLRTLEIDQKVVNNLRSITSPKPVRDLGKESLAISLGLLISPVPAQMERALDSQVIPGCKNLWLCCQNGRSDSIQGRRQKTLICWLTSGGRLKWIWAKKKFPARHFMGV